MNDIPPQAPENDLPDPVLPESGEALSRRDFLKVAAILTCSMFLLLSRCRPPVETIGGELPPIPPDFKRFLLVKPSESVATEKIIVALGSQCPDLSCALWWADDQEFEFFESVDQIATLYMRDGQNEFIWLD
jgi:hypothetical protein